MLDAWLRKAAVLTAAFSLFPLIRLADIDIARARLAGRGGEGSQVALPPPRIMRAMAFGYSELGADLIWLQTVAHFVDNLSGSRDFSQLPRLFAAIVAFDEHFYEIYRFGASMFMSRGARQTNADALHAIALLKRGHRNFPREYGLAFSIGAAYLYELRSPSKKQMAIWRREGADWIHRAALIGAGVPWLANLSARIYQDQGQTQIAIKHLQEIYLTTQDPATKRQIAIKLSKLQAAKLTADLRRHATAFWRRFKSSPLVFVGPDLFPLLDLPPLGPFSLGAPTKASP